MARLSIKQKRGALNIHDIKRKAVPILKKAGVTHSSVFGSVARGEAKISSDIDMLIDFDRKMTLLDLVGLEQELESALGREVDIVTRRSLYQPLKRRIEKEEIFIM